MEESQTCSSKRAFSGIAKLEEPFANPLPTVHQHFANHFCRLLSKLLFPWAPGTCLETRVIGFLVRALRDFVDTSVTLRAGSLGKIFLRRFGDKPHPPPDFGPRRPWDSCICGFNRHPSLFPGISHIAISSEALQRSSAESTARSQRYGWECECEL